MKIEYLVSEPYWDEMREKSLTRVIVRIHCMFGPFNYMTEVGTQFAKQCQDVIIEWAKDVWRPEYEEKRKEKVESS